MKYMLQFPSVQAAQGVLADWPVNSISRIDGIPGVKISAGAAPVSNSIICTINATEAGPYKILGGGDSGGWGWYPSKVIVDGVEMEEMTNYITIDTGIHTIEIIDDPQNPGYYSFHGEAPDGYFFQCDITSVIIPGYVTSIGNGAFEGSKIVSVTIPNSVTSIGDAAFRGCELTSVIIPDSVTRIGEQAFASCENLTSVTIGNSVTNIRESVFANCESLTSITCLATTPPSMIDGSGVFYNTNDCPIYVPAASVDAYKTAWSEYASRIQAIQE